MAKFNIKNLHTGSLSSLVTGRISIVLGVLLFLLVAGEAYIIKDSVTIITNGAVTLPMSDVPKGAAVRVDFKNLEAAAKRMEDAKTYTATSSTPIVNPFGQP